MAATFGLPQIPVEGQRFVLRYPLGQQPADDLGRFTQRFGAQHTIS